MNLNNDIYLEENFAKLNSVFKQTFANLKNKTPKVFIVTDNNVASLFLTEVLSTLSGVASEVFSLVLPAGETNKNPENYLNIISSMLDAGLDRTSFVVALGGGIVSDMAGFAASTYMRGIPFCNIPTTLLSMCDSSIGGKTSINFGKLKNIIGTFFTPTFTYISVSTLSTLPQIEFSNGMAEAVKHSLISNSSYIDELEENSSKILNFDNPSLISLVRHSLKIKSNIVAMDLKEQNGIREILNMGHTVGHALESLSDYHISHGESVSLGLISELYLSKNKFGLDQKIIDRCEKLLNLYHLPTNFKKKLALHGILYDNVFIEKIYSQMLADKKTISGVVRIISILNIGHPKEINPTLDEFKETMNLPNFF